MPGASIRIIGNTVFALMVLTFVAPWAIAQRWPSTAGLAGPTPSQVLVSGQAGGIPPRVLQAILDASETECNPPWYVLAGISKIESDHAWGGQLDANGNVSAGVYAYGPEIAWLDTKAEGPFQFIPTSWQLFGNGGNPMNIDDSARAAARHICHSSGGKTDPESLRQGVYGYNQDWAYVDQVMSWAQRYSVLTPQAGTPETRTVFGDIEAFYTRQGQSLPPLLGSISTSIGSFWGWVSPQAPSRPSQFALPAAKGAPDPQCPGRFLTQDGRFQAPPGSTTPEMTAQVARALRARFKVDSSMLRSVDDRNASDGAATCSDHLWGGGLDTSGVVMAWVRPWEGKIFRFVTDDYLDGHAHISMDENVDTRELQRFLDETCAGYDCAAQASWDPPAQFSHYGEGSLALTSA